MTVPRKTERRGGIYPTGGTAEEYPRTPTVPRDETDAAFETVRGALWTYPQGDTRRSHAALQALTTIKDEMKRLREERDDLRAAWSDVALALGLPPDYSGDDLAPAVQSLQSQLTETRDQLR